MRASGRKDVHIAIREQNNTAVLAVEGDIDKPGVDDFRRACGGLLESTVGSIEFDFSLVTYLDSAGICAIYDFADALDGRCPLRIAGVSQQVEDILRISGLTSLEGLDICAEPKGTGRARAEADDARIGHQRGRGRDSFARSFPSRLDELASVRQFIEEIGGHGRLDRGQIFNLKLAVSEAAANAIEHGLPDGDLEVWGAWHPDRLTVSLYHPGEFRHRVENDPERFRRGMGLPLMLSLTDEVTIGRAVGGGTKVSLSVFLDQSP